MMAPYSPAADRERHFEFLTLVYREILVREGDAPPLTAAERRQAEEGPVGSWQETDAFRDFEVPA